MARIPSGDDIERRLPRGGGSVYGVRPDNTGAALEAVGQKISAFGDRMEEKADRLDIAKAKSFYLTERIKAERELEDEPDFMKWGDRYEQRLGEIAGQAKGMIRNSRQQELFDSEIAVDRARALDGVFGKQKIRLKDRKVADLLKMGDDNFAAIGSTTDEATINNLLTSYKDAALSLRNDGTIDAITEQKLTSNYGNRYAVLKYSRLLQSNPEAVLGMTGGGGGAGYEQKLVKFESAAQAGIVNPDSNATGRHQFMDETWLAQIQRHAPDQAQGKSREEILALRKNPELSRRVFEGFTKDNETQLAAAGLPVNDTTRYLAHWFGAGGAAELMKADPNKPISDFLPKGKTKTGKTWAEANGIEGKTVGQVLGIAEQRMGQPVATQASFAPSAGGQPAPQGAKRDAAWSALTPEQQLKITSEAAAVVERKQAIARVEAEKVYVQGATQQMVDRFGTDEGAAAAYIRQNYTGEAQNKLIASTRDRMGEMRRLDRESKDERVSKALDLIWGDQEIPADLQASLIKDGTWDKVGAEQVAHRAGNPRATNHLWLYENFYSLSPSEKAKVPLVTIKENTSRDEYMKIVEARKKGEKEQPGLQTTSAYVASKFKDLGIDEKNESDRRRMSVFHQEFTAGLNTWARKNNGEEMPPSEQRKLADQLLGKVVIDRPGWFNNDIDKPLFYLTDPESDESKRLSGDLGISPATLGEIVRTLRESDIPVTMENLRKALRDGTAQ